jgi:DNA-binding CsgD family transcriptional regulator
MYQAHPGGMWIPGVLGTMTNLAVSDRPPVKATTFASRGDLTSFFMQLCARLRADSYMLVALVNGQDRSEVRIVASNWIFDAIRMVGNEFIADLVESRLSAAPGARVTALQCSKAPEMPEVLTGEMARLLDVLGHAEIFSLKLHAGKRRYFLLFSAAEPGAIVQETLQEAQILSCYALSGVPEMLEAAAMENPLSERERECLYWVSAGKTTDEVAVILGVSSNTVNSYVAHAIQKFGASNRAMAMATAIRSGII